MTLKELFDKHGSVWLASVYSPNQKIFKPLGYNDKKDIIIGINDVDTEDAYYISDIHFVLYKEPKKTVKKYLWASIDGEIGKRFSESEYSDSTVMFKIGAEYGTKSTEFNVKLTWSETSFEVE